MNYLQLLDKVQQQVIDYYRQHHDDSFFYHNLQHTKDVVEAAESIANHYQLKDEDFFVVNAAAWFHDVGYFEDAAAHEEKSAELAGDFLIKNGTDKSIIDKVKQCILATKMPQQPQGLLEQIICDADLYHLGTGDFDEKSKSMRKEFEARKHIELNKHEWRSNTIQLMQQHHYQTDYAQLVLDEKKSDNLKTLIKKDAQWQQKQNKKGIEEPETPVKKKNDKAVKAKKDDRPDKGIETMFRVSSSNHQRLSDMADNKAHIMITVNSIILSAIISLLLRRLEDHPYLTIPTFIILTISLATMTFSILATRPSLPDGTFTTNDIDEKRVNLLFFGNFYRMNLEQYTHGMHKVMESREFLYGSLIKDVYSQGVVLGKKYRLLRISYNIFMFGLIASVLAFIVASVISGKH